MKLMTIDYVISPIGVFVALLMSLVMLGDEPKLCLMASFMMMVAYLFSPIGVLAALVISFDM